jgi:hypothetical protein
MSYNELKPWRALAKRIPKDVLNPTHRLIIITLITYESDAKGAYFARENISSELGLSYRAVMDNFHYLGSGLVWNKKTRTRQPCVNPECKTHLGIIKTAHYARVNKAQNYRLDWKALNNLGSMRVGAPTITNSEHEPEDVEHEPEDVEHEPEDVTACEQVHPYKLNKPFTGSYKRNYVIKLERWNVVTSGLSENVKRLIKPAPNTELLLDELERQETRLTAVRDAVARVDYSRSHKVGGLFVFALEELAGVKSARESSPVEWCGKCDRETRQFEELSIINGVETYYCPTCSPQAKQLNVTRTELATEAFEWNKLFRNVEE